MDKTNTQTNYIEGIPAYIGNLLQAGIEVRLGRTKGGQIYIKGSLFNAVKLLSEHPIYINRIYFDTFAEKVYYVEHDKTEREWDDNLTNKIRYEMEDRFYATFTKDTIESAVRLAAERNKRNPLWEYMKSLPKWIPEQDESRIDFILHRYFGVKDTELTRLYSRKAMIAIVARMQATLQNPVKCDNCLVLFGGQGKHKSTSLGVLALEHIFGKRYFCDTPFDMAHKDANQVVEGKLIVELQELAKRSKDKEVEKAFISAQVARFRRSHAKHVTEHARKCFMIATTNKGNILSDCTGSRRFWPVTIGEDKDDNWKIDIVGLKRDIIDLYREALYLYKQGEPHWLNDEEELLRIEDAMDYEDEHPLHDDIMKQAKKLQADNIAVQVGQIIKNLYEDLQDPTKHLKESTRKNQAIITDVLLKEGWKYKRWTKDGKTVRGWNTK